MISSRFSSGYQTGDPNAIARRYSRGSDLASNLSNIQRNVSPLMIGAGASPRLPSPAPTPQPESNFSPSEGEGSDQASMPTQTGGDNQTARNAAAFGDSPDNGIQMPAGNATQRWQSPVSPQRRYFWATGRIDARATQSSRNTTTDFDSTFGPDRTHMGSAGTTWDQRQANNQDGVTAAVQQRDLPDSWAPY